MKKVLLLGSGELGKEFVIAAKRAGAYVVACDRYDNAPAMQVADECEVFSMLDGEALDALSCGLALAAARAGYLHDALGDLMQQLRLYRIGGLIINLAPVAAAGDKPRLAKLPQVVRHRRARHIHQRRNIRHALLAVAQQPEDPHAAAVGEELEDIGHGLKAADRLHRSLQPEHRAAAVVVGQMILAHRVFRLSFSRAVRSFYPVWKFVSPERKRRALAP